MNKIRDGSSMLMDIRQDNTIKMFSDIKTQSILLKDQINLIKKNLGNLKEQLLKKRTKYGYDLSPKDSKNYFDKQILNVCKLTRQLIRIFLRERNQDENGLDVGHFSRVTQWQTYDESNRDLKNELISPKQKALSKLAQIGNLVSVIDNFNVTSTSFLKDFQTYGK